ncbi:MAG: hypothetical protein HY245_07650 [Rhizobiales bacterium]|nr:hypothetical protein [Hyphomicrobiales bacterium]
MCWALVQGALAAPPRLRLEALTDLEVATALGQGYNYSEQYELPLALGQSQTQEGAFEAERQRLVRIIQAFGYLEARIDETRSSADVTGAAGAETILDWTPVLGPLYRIGIVEVRGVVGRGLPDKTESTMASVLRRFPGKPARADVMSKIESEVLYQVRLSPFPLAKVLSREIVVQPATRTAKLRLAVDIGPSLAFGTITVPGVHHVSTEKILGYAPFKAGDPFDRSKLTEYQKRLEDIDLFKSVRVSAADLPDQAGQLAILVSLKDRPADENLLEKSGFLGSTVIVALIVAMALRIFLVDLTAPRLIVWIATVLIVLLTVAALALAVQRSLSFLGIVPLEPLDSLKYLRLGSP